ncbi:glycine cleavage system protein GcvH [Hespellia stercorisuis]|uniref:Glycine cleavage system H protein n=1 Tax=Hespellia stercorisuis DSM 15480 TaxID=1121950 RepID=A0A1M6HT75_9FIRM|nr:glycine cleavage system protein GcvH [Hespellia stercorisuis]SHJ25412.1 glycine cleavage system H protein [Hespellia stercorisuis DSM 15480]
MNYPEELKYARSHEWMKLLDDTTALVGITEFAQDALGDMVYANLPDVGDKVTIGEAFADVESVKAVYDIISPVNGVVTAVNKRLLEDPETINGCPYDSWFVEIGEISEVSDLLTAEEYQVLCDEDA